VLLKSYQKQIVTPKFSGAEEVKHFNIAVKDDKQHIIFGSEIKENNSKDSQDQIIINQIDTPS